MAFQPMLWHRAAFSPIAVALTAGAILYPKRPAYAEEADIADVLSRKPIYDDTPPNLTLPSSPDGSGTLPSSPTTKHNPSSPSPTDRLATQIRRTRLALQRQAVRAEDATNAFMTRTLQLEHSFTSTIASLAPPKESNEKVVPGLLYVLVASMAGSIATRNRNIFLRAAVPVAVGIGTAYTVLPLTTRNVGDLVWQYEKRFPVVAENHIRVKERVGRFVETGIAHSQMSAAMLQDKVGGVRAAVEEWVKKGR
ncbi:hypothetical protein W97_06188 [Coniosporium apollinis CBS 100218]|uniref:MICOS complex subunit n=1 Tax=Coniosporium apollinis (strain CBS 100218) TaxID=1168221 RepID=R7YZJ7_CONA1|nr:uncharacterized protein W97_06188 [Coniosporium apollinis CBS 100218]EON67071.1 hypothetical protein W97_06188 [Coniosporium apollinis CBS 100218]